MQRTPHHSPPRPRGYGLQALIASSLFAATAATAQVAHGDTSALDGSGNYREEVQACHEGRTAEDQSTCLKEARHAAADKRRGVLTNQGDFQANALARCDAHRVAIDKQACRERVVGEAGLSGSVAGGGLLRELEVTLPQEEQTRQAQEGPGETGAMGAGPQQELEMPRQEASEPEYPLQEEPSLDEAPGSGMQ